MRRRTGRGTGRSYSAAQAVAQVALAPRHRSWHRPLLRRSTGRGTGRSYIAAQVVAQAIPQGITIPLTAYRLPLARYRSQLTACRMPLTACRLPLAAYRYCFPLRLFEVFVKTSKEFLQKTSISRKVGVSSNNSFLVHLLSFSSLK